MFEYASVCMCVCVFEHMSENLNNFFKCCSNGLLPKTKVIGFQKTNNFRVQSFFSNHTKMGKKWISEKYRIFSNALKSQILSFKLSLK